MVSNINANTEFNYSLHGLRGLAALMVYIAHSCNGFREHLYSGHSFEPLLLHIYYWGTFGVEVFFFLSGYVIFSASRKADFKTFLSHRFWRIYPVFIFFTILFFVLNHFISKDPWKDNIYYLISNGLFINLFLDTPALSPNAWTIAYEVWFYIMTFALLRPLILSKYYLISLLSLIIWGYFIWKFPISIYYVLGTLTNILTNRYKISINNIGHNSVNILQSVSLFIVIYLSSASEYKYHWEYMGDVNLWILMISFNIFMITLFHKGSRVSSLLCGKILIFLGTISYSLYLTHPYSYLIARTTAQKLVIYGVPYYLSNAIYVVLNIAVTSLFVFFVFKFIESKMYKFGTGRTIYNPSPLQQPLVKAPLQGLTRAHETHH